MRRLRERKNVRMVVSWDARRRRDASVVERVLMSWFRLLEEKGTYRL